MISPESSPYAADAAGEVDGVHGLSGRRGVKVGEGSVEVHLVVEWGASIPTVGRDGAQQDRRPLAQMAGLDERPR